MIGCVCKEGIPGQHYLGSYQDGSAVLVVDTPVKKDAWRDQRCCFLRGSAGVNEPWGTFLISSGVADFDTPSVS